MNYEDEEILWIEEGFSIDDVVFDKFQPLLNANLAIQLNLSKNTFHVVKNKWGREHFNVPLNLLDSFLEKPDFNWDDIAGQYELTHKSWYDRLKLWLQNEKQKLKNKLATSLKK